MNKFASCRLCMCLSDPRVNIFEINCRLGIVVATLIMDLIQIEVSESDLYPPVICDSCLDKLVEFKDFKDSCLNTKARFDAEYLSRSAVIDTNQDEETIYLPQDRNISFGNEEEIITDEIDYTTRARFAQYVVKEEIDFTVNEVFIKVESEDDYEIEETESITQWESEQNSGFTFNYSTEILQMENHEQKLNVNITENNEETMRIVDVKSKFDKSPGSASFTSIGTYSNSTVNKSNKDVKALVPPGQRPCMSELRRPTIKKMEHSMKKNKERKIILKNNPREIVTSKKRVEDGTNNEKDVKVEDRQDDISIGWKDINIAGTRKEGEKVKSDRIVFYECDHCHKKFKDNYSLGTHLSIHELEVSIDLRTQGIVLTKEKPFKCSYCEKSFFRKCYQINHERIHNKGKTFKCSYCEEYFCDQSSLTVHRTIHTNEKSFKCGFCERGFSRKSHLIAHERIHTNEKPFKCPCCEKCFRWQRNLKLHERIHTKEKPFKCSYCDKYFSIRGNMRTHERTHTKEKPFKCSMCEKCFSDQGNLIKHEAFHRRKTK